MASTPSNGLTKKHWFGYMFGDWGGCMTFALMSSIFSMYCTNVLGINATVMGILTIIWTIWDAINDPMMGALMDKSFAKHRRKNGKFRPWLLRACGPVALASFLMYQTLATNLPMTLRIVYMFVTYLLWGSICYTCINEEVFGKAVNMINGFKNYFLRHNEVVYENPSPGNKAGGITTLEDKSCGCVQKGGSAPIMDVIGYGDAVTTKGLNMLYGPGNDLVSATALTAAGAHMVLFTTGRGTPFGAPAPTMKISTNTPLATKKHGWIDFNAGVVADGERTLDEAGADLLALVLEVASGKQTKTEQKGYREISIFKDGVVL